MAKIICSNCSGSSERLKMGPIGPARGGWALSADGLGSSRIDSGLLEDGLGAARSGAALFGGVLGTSRMDFGAKQERPTPCPRMCGVKRRPFICFSWLFCLLPSSFLALMQEKKQKKIKASGTPAKFETLDYSRCTQPNFPALGRELFLVLMQEKKQKKIKASGTPAKFETFGHSRCTQPNFPAHGRELLITDR